MNDWARSWVDIELAMTVNNVLRKLALGQKEIEFADRLGYPIVIPHEWFIKGVINALVGAGDSQRDLLARAYLYQAAVVVKMLWTKCNEYRRKERSDDR